MKKLFLLLLLHLVMLSQICALDVQIGHLCYSLDKDAHTATVIRPDSSFAPKFKRSKKYVIPASVTYDNVEYTVTAIGDNAFAYFYDTKFVKLPESLISIGDNAFALAGLKQLTIPRNVQYIGKSAFNLNMSLQSVEWDAMHCDVPKSEDGNRWPPFMYCAAIKTFTFGPEVTNIPDGLCYDLPLLQNVQFPISLKNIGAMAFYNCVGLKSVVIPGSVDSIGNHAFEGCSNLTLLELSEGIKVIGNQSFCSDSGLVRVTVPHSVLYVDKNAFQDCAALKEVEWNAIHCEVPSNEDGDAWPIFINCHNIQSFVIGSAVEYIPHSLCYGLNKLESISIPGSVKSIGGHAFENCKKLSSVVIAEGVEEIGTRAFGSDSALTSIVIPRSVRFIGKNTFRYCFLLNTVEWNAEQCEIPIGENDSFWPIFYGCKIRSLTFGNDVRTIPMGLCHSIIGSMDSITIPDSVHEIGNLAFKNVKLLHYNGTASGAPWGADLYNVYTDKDYIYADKAKTHLIKSKSNYLFNNTIPQSVTMIDDSAFYYCYPVPVIYFPSTVQTINTNPFGKYGTPMGLVQVKDIFTLSTHALVDEFKKIETEISTGKNRRDPHRDILFYLSIMEQYASDSMGYFLVEQPDSFLTRYAEYIDELSVVDSLHYIIRPIAIPDSSYLTDACISVAQNTREQQSHHDARWNIPKALKFLLHQNIYPISTEQRLRIYYELVELKEDKEEHAKQYILLALKNNINSSEFHEMIFQYDYALGNSKSEPEGLRLYDQLGLHEEYANLAFKYANRLQHRENDSIAAQKTREQAWEYAKKYDVTNCSECQNDVYNRALEYIKKHNYKKAADIFSSEIQDIQQANPLIMAQAMATYFQAELYDEGWDLEKIFTESPFANNVTYSWQDSCMLYKYKLNLYAEDSDLSLNLEDADVHLTNTTVDKMTGYNVNLTTDSSETVHIEAQVKVDSLVIEKQHQNASVYNSENRYLSDLNALIQILINEGDYESAKSLCRHAMDVYYYLADELSPYYFIQTSYYRALIASHYGQWSMTLDLLNDALEFCYEMDDWEMIAQYFTLGSQYYSNFHLYPLAVDRASTAFDALLNIPQEQWNHDKGYYIIMNLAKCLIANKDYYNGFRLMESLEDYIANYQGSDHTNMALLYMQFLTYADLYYTDPRYGIDDFLDAQSILSKHREDLISTDNMALIFGKYYVDLYTMGARMFHIIGEDSSALECSEIGLRYAENIYSGEHPYVIPPLIQQTEASFALGNAESCDKNLRYATQLAHSIYGDNHWIVGELQWLMARYALITKDIPMYEIYSDSVVLNFMHNIRNEFTFLTTEQREQYWNRQNQILDSIVVHSLAHHTPRLVQQMYNISLLTKGMLLKTQTDITDIIAISGDSVLNQQYMQLLGLREQQRACIEQSRSFNMEQQHEKEVLEKQIQQHVLQYGDFTQSMSIQWQQVRKKLKKHETAIEFTTIPVTQDSTMYCALLLRKDSPYPELIPLFEEKEVMALVNTSTEVKTSKTYAYNYNGKQLSTLVWSKILPYVKPGETVYFAPSGVLHQVAIEALPYDKEHTMADRFNLVRLSSTREIVLNNKSNTHTTATLYGGIQYSMSEDEILAESEQYSSSTLLASRGLENDTLDRGNIKYLPGTKKEVEVINAMLQNNNLQVQLFTTTSANEESFKAISGKHQNILHIATHGFYWSDSTAQKKDYFSQRMLTMGDDMPAPPSIDPLNRCGLLFAGAQTAWSGHSADLPEGVQDGILTAKEISLLDLRDADLVVLSACETGKGEITGEGVFGLQRAFKQAGAQTIIMSLWPVSDAATQLLMTEFYRNWITLHQSKRQAFRNAQNAVRTAKDEDGDLMFEQPVYWAGFIMLD